MKAALRFYLQLSLVAVALLLQACGGKAPQATARLASGESAVVTENSKACATNSGGRIWDPNYVTNGDTQMTSAVQDFVSTHLPASSIGTVSGYPYANTGVIFSGRIRSAANGAIDAAKSYLNIEIYDSRVGEVDTATGQEITAYKVQFSAAKSGKISADGSVEVLFEDQYGSVLFKGQKTSNYVYGTVHFKNKKAYDNSTPREGTLGSFYIYTCEFLY